MPVPMYNPNSFNWAMPNGVGVGGATPGYSPGSLDYSQNQFTDPTAGVDLSKVPTLTGSAAPTGWGTGLGLNMGTAQLALSGLSTIGSLYGAFQAANLAKKQFDFTKGVTSANLANQISSYNTSLEDRIRSRAVAENQDPSTADAYLASHSLKTPKL